MARYRRRRREGGPLFLSLAQRGGGKFSRSPSLPSSFHPVGIREGEKKKKRRRKRKFESFLKDGKMCVCVCVCVE